MGRYTVKIPWTRQPPSPTAIDRSNPLTSGLAYAISYSNGRAYDGARVARDMEPDNNGSIVVGQQGWAYQNTSGTEADGMDIMPTKSLELINYAQGFTVLHLCRFTGSASQSDEFGLSGVGGSGATNWYNFNSPTDSTVEDNLPHVVSMSPPPKGDGNTGTFYIDGQALGTITANTQTSGSDDSFGYVIRYDSSQNRWESFGERGTLVYAHRIGAYFDSRPNDAWEGEIYLSVFWNRQLTDADHAALAKNPWQIFQPLEVPIFRPAAAASPPYYAQIPWKTQPPQRVERFDKSNPLGAHCVHAIVPAWNRFQITGADIENQPLISVSDRRVSYDFTGNAIGSEDIEALSMIGPNGQPVSAMRFTPTTTRGLRFLNTDGTAGKIKFNSSDSGMTVIGIVKPNGDGSTSSSYDPRIYSEDQGTAESDHDFMIGLVRSGGFTRARARIRIDSATKTEITNNQFIEQDKWNLVAGVIETNGIGTFTTYCRHLRQDGDYDESTGQNDTSGFTPRTSTDAAIAATASTNNNFFNGDILCIMAFDVALEESQLRELFANPWQVFEPQRVPIFLPGGVTPPAITITDVNTTEAWDDGDTGLIITGTGFLP